MIRIGHYQFAPAWISTLATVCLLALLLRLGFWQLDRSDQKNQLIAQQSQYAQMSAKDITAMSTTYVEAQRYLPITATGVYDTQHQFLLDNRTHHGVAGYHVITPFILSDSPEIVLVNRGWVAVGPDRSQLPDIVVHDRPHVLKGRVVPMMSGGLLLGDAGYGHDNWPKVVQRLLADPIAEDLGRPLRQQLVQLSRGAEEGFRRDWPVYYGITPQRHHGYAIQWFALAIALMTIYVAVNTRRCL